MRHDSASIKKSSFNSSFTVRLTTPVTVAFYRLADEFHFKERFIFFKWIKMFPWLSDNWRYKAGKKKKSPENVYRYIYIIMTVSLKDMDICC